MKNILLSIIIPCYNSSDFIEKLLEFFNAKKEEYLELIFVDDHSNDDTIEKIQKAIIKTEIRYKLIKKKLNTGPADARNQGLKVAKGKYVMFLDSDDSLTKDFFYKIKNYLNLDNDAIIFDLNLVSNYGNKYYQSFDDIKQSGYIDNRYAMVFCNGTVGGKIVKREIIDIVFPNILRAEDDAFMRIIFSKCRKIYYLKEALYNYYQTKNSLTHNSNLVDINNQIKAMEYIYKHANVLFIEEINGLYINQYLKMLIINSLKTMKRKDWRGFIDKIFNNYDYKINKYYKDISKKNKIILFLAKHKQYLVLFLLVKYKEYVERKRIYE